MVMMISPEAYYEEYLKGKNEKQILSVIRGLKRNRPPEESDGTT